MEKEEWEGKLLGDHNPNPEATSRSRKVQERMEQRRCQKKDGCWSSGKEEQAC